MALHIGTSGFSYPDWRGRFFPEGLAARDELGFYAHRFDSVEINRSFYALLSPAACLAWYEATPPSFVFPLKGSRFLTHLRRLREPRPALANFFAAGPLVLGEKLGPVVWQLPANFPFDEARLEGFFDALPHTMEEAAALARRHDNRVRVADTEPRVARAIRHVIEPRHPSFHDPAFAKLARKYRIAIAVADGKEWARLEEPTTDFMYVRLHGDEQTYFSDYDHDALVTWADRIDGWRRGEVSPGALRASELRPIRAKDVYVYFDNTALGYATKNAFTLRALLSLAPRARQRAEAGQRQVA